MPEWILHNWAGAVSSLLAGALGWAFQRLWARQKSQAARQNAIEEGVQALLHDRIYSTYADCREKGYADVNDLKNLEFLYRPYHALGGNGTGTELFERVKKMPAPPAEKG